MRWIVLILFCSTLKAQVTYDTIIDKGIYKSYFNKALREPVALSYTLYHGGGIASRDNDHFKGDHYTLSDKDYYKSGYDRGHLVPAEDFAYSDSLQAITFSYYNCVPQFPKLNRGKWKKYEEKARKLSQSDTIIVLCYLEFDILHIGRLNVPKNCYKIVYDENENVLFSVGFMNDKSCKEIWLDEQKLQTIKTTFKN